MRQAISGWIKNGPVLLLVSLVGGACGGGDETDVLEEELASEFAEESSTTAATVNDAGIADLMVTAITSGRPVTELATTRSENATVVRFAEVVLADHDALAAETQRLLNQLGLIPQAQPQSRELQQATTAARAALDSLSGVLFDRTYILREIEYHRTVLELFERTVIPSVQSPQLRALIENLRPALAAHLQRAEQLRYSLRS